VGDQVKRTQKGDGVTREINPRPRAFIGAVPLTIKKPGNTISHVKGWIKTLDQYWVVSLDQMLELLLISAQHGPDTVEALRKQAQTVLSEDEYQRYLDLSGFVTARIGISAEIPSPGRIAAEGI